MAMAPKQPEPPEGGTQSQGHLAALPGCSVLEQPAHGCSQIVMFPFQLLEPYTLLSTIPVLGCLLCKLQVVHRMSVPGRFSLAARCQTLQPILADRLQQEEAWFRLLLHLLQQTLVNERGHALQHVHRLVP